MFDRLEQFDEGVPAEYDAFRHLIYLDVTNLPTSDLKIGTYIKEDSKPRVYCLGRWEWL